MASVTLTHLWIHDADDPADHVRMRLRDHRWTDDADVDVRRYAAGRDRIVRRPGVAMTLQVACRELDDAAIRWLRARIGATVLVRTPRDGRLAWATCWTVPVSPILGTPILDVDVTFTSVTPDETV